MDEMSNERARRRRRAQTIAMRVFYMSEVTVIEADLNDCRHQTAILQLINAYARDPMGDGRDLPATVRDRLISGLRQHPTALVLLAFDDATPVGVAVCFVGFSTFAARR
jgi:hypothetical protein